MVVYLPVWELMLEILEQGVICGTYEIKVRVQCFSEKFWKNSFLIFLFLLKRSLQGILQWNSSWLNISVLDVLYHTFIWIFFLASRFSAKSIDKYCFKSAKYHQNEVYHIASNIPYPFEQVFAAYVSTHLLFYIYLLISSKSQKVQ